MNELKLGDILNSVNSKNTMFTEEETKPAYVPFVVNRTLSYFMDTVMFANEVNQYPDCPPHLQYLFYRHGVRKGRRFSKWHKSDDSKYLDLVKEYYQYSTEKARAALKLLTDEQLEIIRTKLDTGGRK